MHIVIALLLVALGSIWSPQARAEPGPLQGAWSQITSNAGDCADCRVSIERNGSDLIVTANNGWSAVVRPEPHGIAAIGAGNWKPNFGGPYGGRPFKLHLAIVQGKLLMIMTVPWPDGSTRQIKATFKQIMLVG